ncbi:MAG: M20 family metallopeptidase [Geminicoccaceae bacterium]
MALEAREREVLAWLEAQYPAMIELLGAVVNTDSNSYDKPGVDAVIARFRRHLDERGLAAQPIETAPVSGARFGDCLKATLPASDGDAGDRVLLLGHCDTVFPKGEVARRPFRVEGNRAYGPGVADMKAGLVMNTFVLEALARSGGARHPLAALYTSDEEIASGASRPVIEAAAKGTRAVFNAEPGRPSGNLVSGRKGAMFLTIETTGVAAHSGVAPEKGRSAIEELCRKVLELHALTDLGTGTTFNVGLIQGGQSINTVAPHARARVDVRFKTMTAMEEAEAAIREVVGRTYIDGTTTRLAEKAMFLPLEETAAGDALFEHYRACAVELGLEPGREYTGGSADSGFTAAAGAPTLCGTGPVGEKAHSPDEVCHVDTLVPKAQALALAILRLDR